MSTWQIATLLVQLAERYEREGLADYWPQEKAALEKALQAIEHQLPAGRYTPVQVVGVGGSGIVVRLSDGLFPQLDRALKFPRPVPGKVQLIAEMLSKEVAHLAELRHPGIIRILGYGTCNETTTYDQLPYYLMEFVEGSTSRHFVRHDIKDEASFTTLVARAVDILQYLHTRSPRPVAHLDIKPENLLVTAGSQPIAIDLGTCKALGPQEGLTTVACTRSYAHPALVRRLAEDPSDNNRAKGEVSRSEIDPCWDLWSFGLTLLDWIGIDVDAGTILEDAAYHRLGPYTRKYYLLLAARLLSYSVRSWLPGRIGLSANMLSDLPIRSAAELKDLVERLDGSTGPVYATPELSAGTAGTIQAAPGLHVAYTPRLKAVVDHRLYRRLNSVSQLGLVSQVYPGAKHTRREHSLGTYANTIRFIRALYDDPYSPLFRQLVTEEDCRALLLASLLHDIGQFPLAHDLEEIDKRIFSHAELTHALIQGEWQKKKKGSRRIEFDSFADVFKQWEVTPDRVAAILSAKPTNTTAARRDKLLRSMISGPIDADKLDYLLRDARHTDVPYPLGIDVDRLLRCLTAVVIDRVESGARDVPAIGVHAKGRVAAEFLTMARYAMFSQVYWHHAVRAQKAMLFRAVEVLLAQLRNDDAIEQFRSDFIAFVTQLPELLYEAPAGNALLFPELTAERSRRPNTLFASGSDVYPTDAAVLAWFEDRLTKSARPEAGLIQGLLSRRLFKRLWVVSHEMEPKRWEKIAGMWDSLDRGKRHQVALEFERAVSRLLTPERTTSVTKLKAEEARERVQHNTAGEIPWLLIDIPGARAGSDIGLYCVLEGQRRQLRKDDRAVGDLHTSPAWERYARDLRQAAGKIRVFAEETLVDTIESSIPWETGIDELESVLTQIIS
jgi:HD superfamily phosphohydrolase